MESYSLLIKRYNRYIKFEGPNALEDLRNELRKYMSPSEIEAGVIDSLTCFSESKMRHGYLKNGSGYVEACWRDYSVIWYSEILEMLA